MAKQPVEQRRHDHEHDQDRLAVCIEQEACSDEERVFALEPGYYLVQQKHCGQKHAYERERAEDHGLASSKPYPTSHNKR